MSSIDYAELQGLNIAKTRHSLTALEYRDQGWLTVNEWLTSEIGRLMSLKK
jgi:hypothetical protein